MSLVVGHNCPGCGLDTPEVACESCGGVVVWDRESGSRCGACGVSASNFTCPECGLRTELDEHEPERVARAPVPLKPVAAAEHEAADGLRSFAWLPHVGTTIARSPALRSLAVVALVGLPALAIVLLVGGPDGSAPRREAMVATAPTPERLARGTVQLSLEAKPVPLPPRNPAFDPPPPLAPPRFSDVSPPTTWADSGYRAPAPRRDGGWFQRMLRSGRGYSAANDRLPADAPGIGR